MASVAAAPMASLPRAIEFVTDGPPGLLPPMAAPAFTDSFLFGSMIFSSRELVRRFCRILRHSMHGECTARVHSFQRDRASVGSLHCGGWRGPQAAEITAMSDEIQIVRARFRQPCGRDALGKTVPRVDACSLRARNDGWR